jgi:hypothetical protein
MPYHDVECTKCGTIIYKYYKSPWPSFLLHEDDGGELIILWQSDSPHSATAHPRDRTVIYRNPLTGEVSYPPRNDEVMPSRYREAGYVREEFEHARDVEKFEKERNVRCEGLWYNSGNGV